MATVSLESSAWAARRPGLSDAARVWLSQLDERLAEAHQRGRRILHTNPVASGGIARLGSMTARTAPRLVPAMALRDGEAAVRAFADAALRGGPTFVKIGQLLSTTRGLAPDWVADAFADCRDAVPHADPHEIAHTLESSGVLEGVRSWDKDPIASASVAQVHQATLNDGTDAVIKVRRPGIVRVVAADMSYLIPALKIAEARNDRLRIANLSRTFVLMAKLFAQEVDLRLEAGNIAEMALAFERSEIDVELPVPIPGLVSRKAMVMERIDGVSAADADGAALYGHDGEALVRLALVGVLETALNHGIFHGDLHPGNVLVTPRGLALLDFGIVGRITIEQRHALVRLLGAMLSEDRTELAAALQDFGAIPRDADVQGFFDELPPRPTEDEIKAIMADRRLLEARVTLVIGALSRAGFRITPELSLFAKNILYLGDAAARHAPDMAIVEEAAMAIGRFVTGGPPQMH